MGLTFPQPARAGRRLRQERRRHRRAGRARASASSRSARSPASRSPATRGRGCSGCPRTARSSTGWASTTTAPRWWPAGSPRRGRARAPSTSSLGVNIGKTKVVPEDDEARSADYAKSARLLAPYADYLVVNVSSPNTPGLRDLQAVERLEPLLRAVRRRGRRRRPTGTVPLLVKIAPDLADDDVLAVADLAVELGPRRHHRHQHHDHPRRAAPRPPPRSRRPGPAGSPGAPLTARAARGAAAAPRRGSATGPHPDRRRRHQRPPTTRASGSTPAPTCCRPTPPSSTRARSGRAACSRALAAR